MADTEASAQAPRPLPARIIAWALQRKPVRAFLLYSEHRGPMLADSITYRLLFAVFAAVLLGFSLAALWLSSDADAWQALITSVNSVVPGLVGTDGLIDPSDIQAPAGLSVAGVLSSIGLLGAAVGSVAQMRAALRSLADKPNEDTFFVWVLLRNLAVAIGVGVALVAAAAVTFFGTALVDVVGGWFGVPADHPLSSWGTWLLSTVVVLALDTVVIAVLFRVLSGVTASGRVLWTGALLGGVGLVVLQQLSGLFVGGARSNPLLASFAALIALLLWFNLSSQVVLIASAYILTGLEEQRDRVRARFGASTFLSRQVQRAEIAVNVAKAELDRAREAEQKEREAALAGSKGTT